MTLLYAVKHQYTKYAAGIRAGPKNDPGLAGQQPRQANNGTPGVGRCLQSIRADALISTTIRCMSLWVKKIMLFLALAVMPLQGIAATLALLVCHNDATEHALRVTQLADSLQHGPQHNSPEDGSNASGNYHPCGHNTVSAPLVVTLLAAAPDPVRAFAPDPLHDLFVPDRPQRPPLA
jgi:hypothetical protein